MLIEQKTDYHPLEQYCTKLQSVCGCFELEGVKGKSLIWGGVSAHVRAGLEIALVATDLNSATRTARNISFDGSKNYFLIVQQFGRAQMSQNDVKTVLLPGDMMLIDSSQPSEFRFNGAKSMQVSVHMERAQVREYFGHDLLGGITLSRENLASKAVCAILESIFQPKQTGAHVYHLQNALLGLLGVFTLNGVKNRDDAEPQVLRRESSLLQNLMSHVEAQYQDPHLCISKMAQTHSVSTRQIQRVFKLLGVTPTQFILNKRLEFARAEIEAIHMSKDKELISTIAYKAGFSDISYFNRRFKEKYGNSPKEHQSIRRNVRA